MLESSTYQGILQDGRIEALQATLLRVGRRRFGGPASEAVEAALKAITDEERLGRMTERLLDASSWQELLETR
jgi:hypothetical protein